LSGKLQTVARFTNWRRRLKLLLKILPALFILMSMARCSGSQSLESRKNTFNESCELFPYSLSVDRGIYNQYHCKKVGKLSMMGEGCYWPTTYSERKTILIFEAVYFGSGARYSKRDKCNGETHARD